ncbi:MAG: agmatinase [Acidobacteriota bacterium]|jgi:agmatinase|nr:agmatinase [Acidobacteriota bacterium]
MNSDFFQPAWNFLALPDELASPERARGWLLPIPYEATISYGAGTREGPAAILAASRQVELYDHEFGCEPAMEYGIHALPAMNPVVSSPDAMIEAIEQVVAGLLSGKKPPETLGVLGGEHSISAGVVRGLARARSAKNLVAVHVDAHADMRDEYEGSPYSHACAARRIVETCPVFQIGIRNLSLGEADFLRSCKKARTVFSEASSDPEGGFLKDLAKFVRNKNVYLTIDLDGLDPSIMPAVGTPEPGGISWERMLEVARAVSMNAASVPVFDVVELAPLPGYRAADFLAAKLVYKLFSYILMKGNL